MLLERQCDAMTAVMTRAARQAVRLNHTVTRLTVTGDGDPRVIQANTAVRVLNNMFAQRHVVRPASER